MSYKIREPSQWRSAANSVRDAAATNCPPDSPDRPIADLLDHSDEGLIILIREGEMSLFHKFKSQGGVLHAYLAILLEELQKIHGPAAPPAN